MVETRTHHSFSIVNYVDLRAKRQEKFLTFREKRREKNAKPPGERNHPLVTLASEEVKSECAKKLKGRQQINSYKLDSVTSIHKVNSWPG